jgi:hypothetical protein
MINTKPEVEEGKSKRQVAQEEKECFWREHIQRWRESRISQVGYCREHGLKETAFTYWKGKLTQAGSASSDTSVISGRSAGSGTPPVSLVPVGVKVNVEPESLPQAITPQPDTPQAIAPKPLVVVVDGRYRIEVGGDFESATLGKLVSTLRQL